MLMYDGIEEQMNPDDIIRSFHLIIIQQIFYNVVAHTHRFSLFSDMLFTEKL